MGLSKKDTKLVTDPLWDNNPVTVQVLGICSALAITAQLKAAIVMSLSFTFVLVMGNVTISLLRNVIPPKIRIIAQLIVAAALVIVVDFVLKAYVYDLSKQLSVYVGLIITNCILMGRFEAFALGNPPGKSFLDATGNFQSIQISKSNGDPENKRKEDGKVDAIAGSTLTGNGVQNMIRDGLEPYISYIKSLNK